LEGCVGGEDSGASVLFDGAADYYARASSRPFLRRIETPTLILQARDDPFMTDAVLPEAAELSPAVTLELSARGGHVGFVGGPHPLAPVWWIEARAGAFLAEGA
jgi:predicted alpha/beta-fold hydrolase